MSFEFDLAWKYRLKPEDVEPTDSPGYWRIKEPCGGRAGGCKSPLHGFMFCEDPIQHTVQYHDPIRGADGKFTSPYRTWRKARGATLSETV